MTIGELMLLVRMMPEVSDVDETKTNQYQMYNAVNSVLSSVFTTLAKHNSSLTIKPPVTLTLTAGEVNLPSDFIAVMNLTDTAGKPLKAASKNEELNQFNYRIIGAKIYSVNDSVVLTYKSFFTRVSDTEDIFPLPDYFIEMVKDYTAAALGFKQYTTSLADEVLKLVAVNEYNEIERQMPFFI